MNNKNVKVVDEHNIDRNANIMFGVDLNGSEYVVYWIERDETSNNVFVSKVLKNLDGTYNMLNIDDDDKKREVSEYVKYLISASVSDQSDKLVGVTKTLPNGQVAKIIAVSFNKEQNINVPKTYITTVKKEVTKVVEDYYDVVASETEIKTVLTPVVETPVVTPVVTPEVTPEVEEVITNVVPTPVEAPTTAAGDIVGEPAVETPVVAPVVTPVENPVTTDQVVAPVVETVVETPVVEVPVQTVDQQPILLDPTPVVETPVVTPVVTPEVTPESVVVVPPVQPVPVTPEPVVVAPVATETVMVQNTQAATFVTTPTEVPKVETPVVTPEVAPVEVKAEPFFPVGPTPVVTENIVNTSTVTADQPLVFNAAKETNLNAALGEVANSNTIPVENINVVREFGEETPVVQAVTQPTIAPMVQPNTGSDPKMLVKKAGFANSKFFMVVAIAFFMASCVFLGYEVYNYFQITK